MCLFCCRHSNSERDLSRNMVITLYSVSDGPPSLAVQQCLKYLDLEYNLVNVDFGLGEHMTDDFAKKNPQKEIPVLDDNGFQLGESNAILQYLADKYPKDETLYPKDLQERALVNHRLCFNLSTYYRYISEYVMAPIFFDYQRTPLGLRKTTIALDNFNTYLKRTRTKYAATNNITIADFQLVTATMCLEAINFDISDYTFVKTWYANYKEEYPELWKLVEGGMKEISAFEKNPPDLSHMVHPIHPVRKQTKLLNSDL
ncbi:glutathione S-transferase 1 isoform X1 [Sitophilus oryzae]|uniref:Glutathione S-transferase 1 isoform X1 n=2 Tax=Sitophilus oryzae TaxID=7048 RepID=A0A6J2Y9E7_SITOR|nr:glutathione S-transferase 1 isoform X1 [Sitophilus oryzae]XP_030760483.1 glutathione S-transferase 1 isoform X1 [Sitophilus oryzae]